MKQFVHGKWFDIVAAVNFLNGKPILNKGKLIVVVDDKLPSTTKAQVEYNPLTLRITPTVWAEANQTENFTSSVLARWVLFHELGHIFLHDHNAKQFSSDGTERANAPPEERAEDQADWFGMYLSCPIREELAHLNSYVLSTVYLLPEDIADEIRELSSTYVEHNYLTSDTPKCPECKGTMEQYPGQMICRNCMPPNVIYL